jgi:hypothetical protein
MPSITLTILLWFRRLQERERRAKAAREAKAKDGRETHRRGDDHSADARRKDRSRHD